MGPDDPKFKQLEFGYEVPHQKMLYLIRKIQKPVVALLHGYCLGAGLELSLACDIRLASEDLKIGDHRAKRAICVVCGSSWLLPRIVGFGRATEIIMTGRHLDAKEALDIGLVNKVYPVSEFTTKSRLYIKNLADLPTKCLGYDKAMLNFSQFNEMMPSLHHEFKLFNENTLTNDYREGTTSFIRKQEPKFIGS